MCFRYDVSKHLYAVAYANDEVETTDTIAMRRLVSHVISSVAYSAQTHLSRVLKFDLTQPSELSKSQFKAAVKQPDFVVLLNLMKISCESSYELLHALQANIESKESPFYIEWDALWKDIMYKINFLYFMVCQ